MKILVPFVLWCAAGFFLIGAYRLSPPGYVPGLSANRLANAFFLITTIWLVVRAFFLGKARRRASRKENLFRRLAYIWLCLVVVYMYLALSHIVRTADIYKGTPFFVFYLSVLFVLAAVFGLLSYYKGKAKRERKQAEHTRVYEKHHP